jgi:hypothetical protein
MRQPYPSGGQSLEPLQPAAPPSVVKAVKLMYAGAAVVVVYAVASLLTVGSIKTALHNADKKLTQHQLNAAAGGLVVGTIIFAAILIGLWLWMAWASKGGKNWGRIVSSVLFGLNTLYILFVVIQTRSIAAIFPAVDWFIGGAAVYLLWRPDATAFFQRQGS